MFREVIYYTATGAVAASATWVIYLFTNGLI